MASKKKYDHEYNEDLTTRAQHLANTGEDPEARRERLREEAVESVQDADFFVVLAYMSKDNPNNPHVGKEPALVRTIEMGEVSALFCFYMLQHVQTALVGMKQTIDGLFAKIAQMHN